LIAVTSALFAVIAARPAHAQNAQAEALFSEGDKLMNEGRLGPACEAFEASNRIEQRAGTLLRMGECRERNHQLASAWSAYKDALTRVKDARKKEHAKKRAAALEPKLSYLTVSVADDSRIDGLTITQNGQPLDPALWNRGLPVNGGDYVIAGQAPGHDAWQTTVTVPDESGKVSIEVPRFKEIVKLVTPNPTPASIPMTAPAADSHEAGASSSMWTARRKIALGVAGGSAASLIAGIVLGTQARSKRDEAHEHCSSTQVACPEAAIANKLISEEQRRALQANIAFGVAGALAIGAGVLWFTGAPETQAHHVVVAPSLAPGEAGVVVLGRF